ncbi:hypothetical protein BDZ91DRAFT_814915 [Kalaharituber pfeilii]|nr:hypothetical protein BDZ91DRAFT_814915 [Kalaharituber pfeilii]
MWKFKLFVPAKPKAGGAHIPAENSASTGGECGETEDPGKRGSRDENSCVCMESSLAWTLNGYCGESWQYPVPVWVGEQSEAWGVREYRFSSYAPILLVPLYAFRVFFPSVDFALDTAHSIESSGRVPTTESKGISRLRARSLMGLGNQNESSHSQRCFKLHSGECVKTYLA